MSDGPLALRVAQIRALSDDLRELTLTPAAGSPLPAFSAGSHIIVRAGADGSCRNAYSLASDPTVVAESWRIVVRRLPNSRGGSAWLHDDVREGQLLEADGPRNLFHPPSTARRHVLIAGGIGVTPFVSYVRAFRASHTPFELHLGARDRLNADVMIELIGDVGDAPLTTYLDDGPPAGATPLLSALADGVLREQPLGTHLSVCGPGPMMEAVFDVAHRLGWPSGRLHLERFSLPGGERLPFDAVIADRGDRISVSANESLLEALERAGLKIPFLCRQGVCGECLTRVVSGGIDHRDIYLSDSEHASGQVMMPCVSRCASGPLVLKLTQEVP